MEQFFEADGASFSQDAEHLCCIFYFTSVIL